MENLKGNSTWIIWLCILLFLSVVSFSQNLPPFTPQIESVSGPLPVHQMGSTLIHEHVLVDFNGADQTGYPRWNRDSVIERMLPFLLAVKDRGVNTFIECTPAYLGRDPLLLKELSRLSGIQLITNTGFYGAVQDKFVPPFAFEVSADSLAHIWIQEFEEGIEETGIKPGFIKIAVDPDSILSEIDEKILRAAIITHKETGLTIVSHTGPDAPAFAQMEILEKEGLSFEAWVWTHAQNGTDAGRIRAAELGTWISIDNIHRHLIRRTISQIKALHSAGLLHRVLISHDAGWYRPGEPKGGKVRGYTDIFTHFIPALKEEGFSQAEIDQLLIKNPQEAYGLRKRIKSP